MTSVEAAPNDGHASDDRAAARMPAQNTATGRAQISELWVATAIAAVSATLGWFRLSPVSRGTFWAEDGTIFLHGAIDPPGRWGSLLAPYEGYLHLVPRLVLAVATKAAPVTGWATAVTVLCIAVVGMVAGTVYLCSRSVTPRRTPRAALASITVLTPVTAIETLGNAANIHTYFLWLTPWLLLALPRSAVRGALLSIPMLLAALTEIQTAIFLPLLLVRARDRRTWPVKCALLVGVVAQLVTTLRYPRSGGGDLDIASAVERYFSDALLTSWLGTGHAVPALVGHFGFRVTVLAALPLAACLVIALRRGTGDQRLVVFTLAFAGVASWALSMIANGTAPLSALDTMGVSPATRHAAGPAMFAVALYVVAADAWLCRRTRAARVTVVLAGTCLVAAAITSFVPSQQLRSGGPVWSSEVDTARRACQVEAAPESVRIPIAPQHPSAWYTTLSCAILSEPAAALGPVRTSDTTPADHGLGAAPAPRNQGRSQPQTTGIPHLAMAAYISS